MTKEELFRYLYEQSSNCLNFPLINNVMHNNISNQINAIIWEKINLKVWENIKDANNVMIKLREKY